MPPTKHSDFTICKGMTESTARPGRIVPKTVIFIGVPYNFFVDPRGKCII
jgi:hypothetical protein